MNGTAELVGILGGLLGIAAVVIPAVYWAVRRIESNRDSAITAFLSDDKRMHRLDRIDKTLDSLANKLESHMDAEERITDQIVGVQERILAVVKRSESNNVKAHQGIVKSLATSSGKPVSLYEWRNGDYHYLWGNQEYHDMIGLDQQECAAGEMWKCVHPRELSTFQAVARDVAAKAETLIIDWELVDPQTGEGKGCVHAVSEFMPSEDDDRWYYVATYHWERSDEYMSDGTIDSKG